MEDVPMATDDLPALGVEPPLVGHLNPMLRDLQDSGPISKVRTPAGDEAWFVARYAEVKQLLMDPRLGRSHPDPANMPRYYTSKLLDMLVTTTDPEEDRLSHTQMRSTLTPLFTPKRMAAMRPLIAKRVSDAVDMLLAIGPPADMHSQFSFPLSFGVLCDLLGLTESDEYWMILAEVTNVADDAQNSATGPLDAIKYLTEVAARRRESPGEDVISLLCQAQPDDFYVASAVSLLTFTYQATPTTMSASIALLAGHPEQRDMLIKDPALLHGAIEEALRMGKVGESFVPRYASQDIEIGDVTIKTGDLVLCDHFSASLDERMFGHSDRFDITRSPNPHLAFSRGIWHCIGAPLAKIEIEEVFTALVSRMPGLRLTVPLAELEVKSNEQLSAGIGSIPVTW
jgi:cytochrome P450 monooxygenase